MPESSLNLSIVIPVFNERETLVELHRRIVDTLEGAERSFEIITVDDGSTDGSYETLKEIRDADPRLRVIRLARNFGQSPALYAGFTHATGEIVVMLDADLQNYPEDIPKLIEKLDEGYDMVSGWRAKRQDSALRHMLSRALNTFVAKITKVSLHDHGCALKAFRRELVDHMGALSHRCRYLPADISALSASVAEVKVRHDKRKEGVSKYSLFKLIRTAFDMVTSLTSLPLQLIGFVGWCLALSGLTAGVILVIQRILQDGELGLGFIAALFVFLTGVQMVATGLMCEYISRIYVEVQRKPYYVIREEAE